MLNEIVKKLQDILTITATAQMQIVIRTQGDSVVVGDRVFIIHGANTYTPWDATTWARDIAIQYLSYLKEGGVEILPDVARMRANGYGDDYLFYCADCAERVLNVYEQHAEQGELWAFPRMALLAIRKYASKSGSDAELAVAKRLAYMSSRFCQTHAATHAALAAALPSDSHAIHAVEYATNDLVFVAQEEAWQASRRKYYGIVV